MKLIFCDLDGTLLFSNSRIQLMRTKQLIPKLKEKGYIFCISSGRAYFELRNFFDDADIYYCASDGAICAKNKTTLFEYPINKNDIQNNLTDFAAYGKGIAYVKSHNEYLIRKIKKAYNGFICEISDVSEIKENVAKLALFGGNINEETKNKFNIIYDKNGITEFVSKGTDKARAAHELAERLKINREDILAFGDNENDISLFEFAGKSFAAPGADIKVRRAAGADCGSVSGELYKLICGKDGN